MKNQEVDTLSSNFAVFTLAFASAVYEKEILSLSSARKIMESTQDYSMEKIAIFSKEMAKIIEQSNSEEEILTKREVLLQKIQFDQVS